MYKISLLPVKYKQAITAERKKNDIIISFIFTIIILSILSVLAFVVNASVKNDLALIQAENNTLLSEIGVLSKYRDMQTQVSVITGEITTLANEAPSFPRTLSEITQSVPDSLQITSIKFTYKKDTKTSLLEVVGNSAYYDDVSAWINTLNGVENIGEVLCSYTNNATDNSTTRVRFELKMDILDKSAVEDIVWQWRSE
ncbi:MAG: PilN domain-containing protein [Eubacteriales bacterium]